MFVPGQSSLFEGDTAPAPDRGFPTLARTALSDGAWLEHAPSWLAGDTVLFDHLADAVDWKQPEVTMYERKVTTPRLVATVDPAVHPAVQAMVAVLSERYGVALDRISANWYRSGDDGVAWHGDRVARDRDTATVATVSLRGPRAFRYKPAVGGPASSLTLGHGDLVVMGGSFQRTWRHSIPKSSRPVPPRMVVMFRHAYA